MGKSIKPNQKKVAKPKNVRPRQPHRAPISSLSSSSHSKISRRQSQPLPRTSRTNNDIDNNHEVSSKRRYTLKGSQSHKEEEDDDEDEETSEEEDREEEEEETKQNRNQQERSDSDSENGSDHGGDTAAATKSANKKGRVYTYAVDNNHRQPHGMEQTYEEEEATVATAPSPTNAPLAIWTKIDESMKQVKVEKTAVHDFVANYLFPKLKFVRGSKVTMDYSTDTRSICALVMQGCHQEHSAEGMIWWAIARKQTVQEIKRLRNDASKNLKVAFTGKIQQTDIFI